ncbi:MAG TPA: RICIN domain-containing protein [Ideonella sp.]|uniref:RICIN domain-containing protein n=1 Tax=Ideonella sp. TaxID=1929293 RepID=UPI002E3483A0|nr:RICIN domain-containing protein [Ideonella sp.]HEX5685820.1 RICIN domain-containing protein [Ideonella sp.]
MSGPFMFSTQHRAVLSLLAVLTAAACGVVAGCGGGEANASEQPETATQAATVAAGTAAAEQADEAAEASSAVLPGATRYVLVNANSGKCIDVAGASQTDGANIQQYSCNGTLAQAFDIVEITPDVYKLLNANSGKAMDVAGGSNADGANIQQWADSGAAAQQFRLERSQGNRYALVNVGSGKCVDVAGASNADGANIQQFTCNNSAAQQFLLYPRGGSATSALPIGVYNATAASSGLCLDIAGASPDNGAKAQQSTCDKKATSQNFEIIGDAGGSYRITNINSGKALDIADRSLANGARAQQWVPGNSDNQRFEITADGTGHAIRAKHSGRCLDVVDNSKLPGAEIQQWDCAGSANQRWQLKPKGAQGSPFGPNVLVFDPSMPASTIQSQVDSVFSTQEANHFGPQRYALLFKPGSYNANVRVGFYTQVSGLGALPDDTTITGTVESNARWFNGNATQNFWRMAENLAVVPTGGTEKWAVSQAAPFRRMHVRGNMVLDDGGWSSGGFIADSKIDGQINSGGQQQWLTRNSQIGSWTGSGWNMVFVGTANAPVTGNWPNPPYTTLNQTPLVREKPFLKWTGTKYAVFVPALRSNSSNTTWDSGNPAGQTLALSSFYVAQASKDTAATINRALGKGKHVLFTPGIYHLTEPIRVNNANTVLLGLGLATLQADNGTVAIKVADVDGVKVAGLLIDAGETNSPLLMEMGPSGSNANHSANPSSLHDVFFRIGGAAVGKATVSLQINSSHVIGDDLWIWRGDHSHGIGWNVNTADTGLIVNGANVTVYGLFVEHYQKYQTLWNGNGGRVYFYQSEAPYDVPTQSGWIGDGGVNGFASYKVANSVTSHEAWGLGVYCYFSTNPGIKLHSAIEAPTPAGVQFHNMTTLSLGGVGEITHVLNNRGNAANSQSVVARLAQ